VHSRGHRPVGEPGQHAADHLRARLHPRGAPAGVVRRRAQAPTSGPSRAIPPAPAAGRRPTRTGRRTQLHTRVCAGDVSFAGKQRCALLIPDPPSGFTGGVLDAPHGHHGLPGGASLRRRLRGSWGFPGGTLRVPHVVARPVAAQIASAKRSPPASAGEGGREPASGAPAHDVLRPNGGGRSPPRVKTGGRAGVRESQPAAELPGISTGGRTAAHLHRRQSGRTRISTRWLRIGAEQDHRGDGPSRCQWRVTSERHSVPPPSRG
jgi:hypothetical protein